jgi:hypothetical protein
MFAVIVSLFAALPQKYLGQRKALLLGQLFLVLSLFSVTLFNSLDCGMAVIISMISLVCAF